MQAQSNSFSVRDRLRFLTRLDTKRLVEIALACCSSLRVRLRWSIKQRGRKVIWPVNVELSNLANSLGILCSRLLLHEEKVHKQGRWPTTRTGGGRTGRDYSVSSVLDRDQRPDFPADSPNFTEYEYYRPLRSLPRLSTAAGSARKAILDDIVE